ncbi:anti-sigma factor family protein [Effusibacillus lacus]|uniref:Anti-sigma-W factor RsiW n=1 Tax=Effusibacillus lacus TaxID=1348429 RepID=A0A292YGQ2_9BACL|nr:zf-HC2 domain-containing protein [Effusibacillus lacus]TCS74790.1 putative zinc finger protein [Effusibacillus lacus]GAX88598.1 hypothetical protein EFBL_0210 [Effusibacillus lacus]
MKCQDPGYIQAYIDGELSRDERKQFSLHLQDCLSCRILLAEGIRLENWSEEALSGSFPIQGDHPNIDVEAAWAKFQHRTGNLQPATTNQQSQRRWPFMKNINKKWLTAAAAATFVLGSLSFSQVRAMAEDFLSVFRVDKVEFVKLTDSDMREIHNWLGSLGEPGVKELKGIGKMWVDDQGASRHARTFDSMADAKSAGYSIAQAPKEFVAKRITVYPSWTLHAQMDTQKANQLFKQLNVDAKFDNSLDGKEFSLTFPENIRTEYVIGNPAPGSVSRFSYHVSDAPYIKVPEGTDLEQFRSTFLKLPFIPDNVKKQLAGIEDWKRTLPLPFMENRANMKQISVQGTQGLLVNDPRISLLIWQKDGKLYQIETRDPVSNKGDALIKIANEIK